MVFVDSAECLVSQFVVLRKNNCIFTLFRLPKSGSLSLFYFIFADFGFLSSLLEDLINFAN